MGVPGRPRLSPLPAQALARQGEMRGTVSSSADCQRGARGWRSRANTAGVLAWPRWPADTTRVTVVVRGTGIGGGAPDAEQLQGGHTARAFRC